MFGDLVDGWPVKRIQVVLTPWAVFVRNLLPLRPCRSVAAVKGIGLACGPLRHA